MHVHHAAASDPRHRHFGDRGIGRDHKATHSHTGGTPMLLVGGQFSARFKVQSPAQQPTPSGSPVPDATASYSGKGSFVSTDTRLRAS